MLINKLNNNEGLIMDTMTILKIIFTTLLCIPILVLSMSFVGKLIDELVRRPKKQS
ncbi:MAG: hypothetical protein PHR60_02160 [Eubacteriales bacterium]|nr:hypothetical protein [Eubacteriales bacterium]